MPPPPTIVFPDTQVGVEEEEAAVDLVEEDETAVGLVEEVQEVQPVQDPAQLVQELTQPVQEPAQPVQEPAQPVQTLAAEEAAGETLPVTGNKDPKHHKLECGICLNLCRVKCPAFMPGCLHGPFHPVCLIQSLHVSW